MQREADRRGQQQHRDDGPPIWSLTLFNQEPDPRAIQGVAYQINDDEAAAGHDDAAALPVTAKAEAAVHQIADGDANDPRRRIRDKRGDARKLGKPVIDDDAQRRNA